MDASILQQAVEFASANEYSGSRDLRVAIHSSFGFEPFDEIVGPTKERGGPAGMILKDGYIVARWLEPTKFVTFLLKVYESLDN